MPRPEATGYQVWRSAANDPATAVNITPANLTSTTFDDAPAREPRRNPTTIG